MLLRRGQHTLMLMMMMLMMIVGVSLIFTIQTFNLQFSDFNKRDINLKNTPHTPYS